MGTLHTINVIATSSDQTTSSKQFTVSVANSSTPLILDLDGDGVETLSLQQGVNFDIDADGIKDKTGWVAADDGLLVWDKNNDGIINNASELLGQHFVKRDGSRASDGFAALADMDSNNDNIIDSNDQVFSQLQVWQDINSDGISQADELLSLSDINLSSIQIPADSISELYQGNWHGLRSSWTSTDQQQHNIDDVWFNYAKGLASAAAVANSPTETTEFIGFLDDDFGLFPTEDDHLAPLAVPSLPIINQSQLESMQADNTVPLALSALMDSDSGQINELSELLLQLADNRESQPLNGDQHSSLDNDDSPPQASDTGYLPPHDAIIDFDLAYANSQLLNLENLL